MGPLTRDNLRKAMDILAASRASSDADARLHKARMRAEMQRVEDKVAEARQDECQDACARVTEANRRREYARDPIHCGDFPERARAGQ